MSWHHYVNWWLIALIAVMIDAAAFAIGTWLLRRWRLNGLSDSEHRRLTKVLLNYFIVLNILLFVAIVMWFTTSNANFMFIPLVAFLLFARNGLGFDQHPESTEHSSKRHSSNK